MGSSFASYENHLQTLEQLLGAAAVKPWETLSPVWQQRLENAVVLASSIAGLVSPVTQAELADVVSWVGQKNWGIIPCGAGSKVNWGGLAQPDRSPGESAAPLLAVSTERLDQLIDHAVGDLTVTVEAGMRFAKLQEILAKSGQFLAIDPAFPDQATIGGIVATADTGSLRQRYNSVRDMLLGLTFVRSDGQVAKAGGRVVKNVAGYDLMKLFTGSYGSLGVITQVTFRVFPLPEASQTVVLIGEPGAIAEASASLLGSALTPVSVDVLSQQTCQALNLTSAQGIALAVRFQGMQSSIEQQAQRTVELGQSLGLTMVSASTLEADLWTNLRKLMTAEGQTAAIACKIGVRPSDAVAVLEQMNQILSAASEWYGQVHTASGIGRIVFPEASLPPGLLLKVRSLCEQHGGFLSVLQAPMSLKQQVDVWGYPGNALDLMRKLKQQFDPASRLSPHRFIGGI